MAMSAERVLRSSRIEKAVQQGKRVETANSLSAVAFFKSHCQAQVVQDLHEVCSRLGDFSAIYSDAENAQDPDLLEKCFQIIKSTSEPDYRNSEAGWFPSKKKKEMMLPDMKYIFIVRNTPNPLPSDNLNSVVVLGFISFMITYEDAHEVAYIYEIHLKSELHGVGLGKALMKTAESIGQSVGVQKIMLTVFKANSHAVEWYHRQGYNTDEYSPGPRKLRNGTVKQPSYVILSKSL